MFNIDEYKGHTPGPWTYNDIEGREIWKCLFNGECFTDPSTYGRQGYEEVLIATMAPLPTEGEDFPEEEFTTMMANKMLMADAPLLLDFIVWVKNTHSHYYHKLTKAYQGAKNNR